MPGGPTPDAAAAEAIQRICDVLLDGDIAGARRIAQVVSPFTPVLSTKRTISAMVAMQVFRRDGFIDRYAGTRLLFPGTLRLLSHLLPAEFPYHPNWKVDATHPAYWHLFPTIDHVMPVAHGGVDNATNWVSTSQLHNSAKAHWTLAELGWQMVPPGNLQDWDGLTAWFLAYLERHPAHGAVPYLRRWATAALRVPTSPLAALQSGDSLLPEHAL